MLPEFILFCLMPKSLNTSTKTDVAVLRDLSILLIVAFVSLCSLQ